VVHSVLERKVNEDQKKNGGTIGTKFGLVGIYVVNTIEEFLADPELQLVRFILHITAKNIEY
jgi:hypothetical protein